MPIGKTRRQIRRARRGWSFSSSSPRPRNTSTMRIKSVVPFRKTSSNHSAWRTVSSKHSDGQSVMRGRGLKSSKTRKSRKSRK